jgi:ubiquinone/menaquinone biosynthesis C-methylase UbiE
VPEGWQWDDTLFGGSAAYYRAGRLPYPAALHDAFAAAADLRGSPRLVDVGCGPGVVALLLADLFVDVVGVDPDGDMLAEAARAAAARQIENVRWLCRRAEELPSDLGPFRYATFAQSFHWMDRDLVAGIVFELLEPGGAFVHVDTQVEGVAPPETALPHPAPPRDEIDRLRVRYLGPVRRAGAGTLRHGTPGDEWQVLERAGFEAPAPVRVEGRVALERTTDDVVASVFSSSGTAPHLFGDRLADFERDLRRLLWDASPTGWFSERTGDVELVFYRRPAHPAA